MDKLIFLEKYKYKRAAQRGFRKWKRLFRSAMIIDEETRWSDLPDFVILFLCEDTRESRLTIYGLLMGALDLGRGYEFE